MMFVVYLTCYLVGALMLSFWFVWFFGVLINIKNEFNNSDDVSSEWTAITNAIFAITVVLGVGALYGWFKALQLIF